MAALEDASPCRGCSAMVVVAVIKSGRRAVFDAEPSPLGTWRLTPKKNVAPWADEEPDRSLFDQDDDGYRHRKHVCVASHGDRRKR